MSKFIEITIGGKKHIINTSFIESIESRGTKVKIYFTTKISTIGYANCEVDELYSDVKEMLIS